jgi:hypothetical protein
MMDNKEELLGAVDFGSAAAEQEAEQLSAYFVETYQWKRIEKGEIDLIFGRKGTGKSAIYALIKQKEYEFVDRRLLICSAENPQGNAAFELFKEQSFDDIGNFAYVWKLYFLCLISRTIEEYKLQSPEFSTVRELLAAGGFMKPKTDLKTLLRFVYDYIAKRKRISSVEGGFSVDPETGIPGLSGAIVFAEPSAEERATGKVPVGELISICNDTLRANGYQLWILVDRLDAIFYEKPETEKRVLRSLFEAYKDFMPLKNISLKIFMRTDIWQIISDGQFREASHLERQIELNWPPRAIVNLIVQRVLFNADLVSTYKVNGDDVRDSYALQEGLIAEIFPTFDEGASKRKSFADWVIENTADASDTTTPREVVQLLNALKRVQLEHLSQGAEEPSGTHLFSVQVYDEALKIVADARLQRTIYAEYPQFRPYIMALENMGHEFFLYQLKKIWKCEDPERIANSLVELGVLKHRLSKSGVDLYRLPLIYRTSLLSPSLHST